MRTTVDLPEPLLENAKKLAAERRVTLSAVIEDSLRSLLAHRPDQLDPPFRLHTVRGRLVRPDLNLDRTSSILLEDDEASFGKES